jgi:hypothetical protein
MENRSQDVRRQGLEAKEEGGRRKEEGGRRKEEGGRRKEEGGRRKEEDTLVILILVPEAEGGYGGGGIALIYGGNSMEGIGDADIELPEGEAEGAGGRGRMG